MSSEIVIKENTVVNLSEYGFRTHQRQNNLTFIP